MVALGSALLVCSCLQVNGDFTQIQGGSQQNLSTAITGSPTLEDGRPSTDLVSSSSGEMSDRTSGTSDSVSTETRNPSSSTGGTTSSSDSPDSTGTTDPLGARWIPIAIQNQSGSFALESQTAVRVQFDHADLVVNHAAANDGSNLRVMVSDGVGEREIDRVLDPGSSWNHAQTQIWFSIDAEIPAGQTQERRYFLVIDPSSTSPKQDPTQIFLAYDEFNGSSLNLSIWASLESTDGPGTHSLQVSGGELVLRASASGAFKRAQSVRSVSSWQLDAIAIDAAVRTDSSQSGGANCTREFLAGFWSPSPSTYVRSLLFYDSQSYAYANHRDEAPYDFRVQTLGSSLWSSAHRRYSMRWRGPDVQLAVDGSTLGTMRPEFAAFTQPTNGPLIAGFEAVASGGCPGQESHLAIDWVMVRKAGRSEPALHLQLSEATLRSF